MLLDDDYLLFLQTSQIIGTLFLRPCALPCSQERPDLGITEEITLAQCSTASLSLHSEDNAFCKLLSSTRKSSSLLSSLLISESHCSRRARDFCVLNSLLIAYKENAYTLVKMKSFENTTVQCGFVFCFRPQLSRTIFLSKRSVAHQRHRMCAFQCAE